MLGVFDVPIEPNKAIHAVVTSVLHNGAIFFGYQTSKGKEYNVEVTIQYVDYDEKFLCGFLKIDNLTEEYPSLTTYFEGEIVCKKFPFATGKWDATLETDILHWNKIPAIENFSNILDSDFNYSKLENSDYIFMRWKEKFLVPDPHIKDINGASFAGFYYISLNRVDGKITGYYYHLYSERYQSLNLSYRPEKAQTMFQFR
ncbi:unnamed protein product [Protopolystoma xenopodis]|uniref:Uncharacterized protein n=1 Tax=Protopolystoma xenopodis TaxID=117903 RepID=A0A3S5BU12_9PLAT|nr:unnamed protein product [Protopolystoma xenopodis]